MNNNNFMLVPLNLVYDEEYKVLSIDAILIYSLFLNRTKFSMLNKNFTDEKGVFIYYSTRQISKQLNCSVNTVKKRLCELEKAELIKREYQRNGLPIKIYVNDKFQITKGVNSYKKQEKEVSFNVKKTKKIANDGTIDFGSINQSDLLNFAEKTKKRRTRNLSPTL